MAKGKGKGYGKGRGDDDFGFDNDFDNDIGDSSSGTNAGSCCCCLCLCFLLPPIILLVGVFIVMGNNTRVDRINEYNTRAEKWNTIGLPTFRGANFTVNKQHLDTLTETSGSYYPVRDACNKKGDPATGCNYTEALYYETVMTVDPYDREIQVKLMGNNSEIVDTRYKTYATKTYTPSDMGCSKKTSECASKCHNKGGSWDSGMRRCTVTRYISQICYRVTLHNGEWKLDVPPTWQLHGSGAGCYYDNNYNPAVYSKQSSSSIPVRVRYYMDSFISAEEMTMGCSSSSSSSSSCFGMSRSEQNKTGGLVSAVGFILTAAEVAVLISMCICCKSTLTGMFNKKQGLLNNNNNNTVPTAQPAYAPAQPSYAPAQPGYAPAQPTYAPAQPGYAPAQPGYAPAQPSYAPAQPGYAPQPGYAQPGYAPAQPTYAPQPGYGQ